MGSWAEGARGHGRSTGAAAFLYRPDIGCKHEEDWCAFGSGPDGAGGLRFASQFARSSSCFAFFKRDGWGMNRPWSPAAASANNFLENDGSVLPPTTSILPPVGLYNFFLNNIRRKQQFFKYVLIFLLATSGSFKLLHKTHSERSSFTRNHLNLTAFSF